MEHSTSPNADLCQGAEESDRLPEAAFPEEGFQYFDKLLPITAQMACHVPTHILDDVLHRHQHPSMLLGVEGRLSHTGFVILYLTIGCSKRTA